MKLLTKFITKANIHCGKKKINDLTEINVTFCRFVTAFISLQLYLSSAVIVFRLGTLFLLFVLLFSQRVLGMADQIFLCLHLKDKAVEKGGGGGGGRESGLNATKEDQR